MRLTWEIEEADIRVVTQFVESLASDPFVQFRKRRNLGEPRPVISKARLWMAMVGCLLSTQQRSGPGMPVTRFLSTVPFPLGYDACKDRTDVETYARETIEGFRGIRFAPTIACHLRANLERLEAGLWAKLIGLAEHLNRIYDPQEEREAAHFVDDAFEGFGPKQSRNLLQWVGVSKFEIPLDSRVTKWLNEHVFPFRLSATVLSDPSYYDLVSDGIQELCAKADVYPCVLDAAIFTSFDKGGWSDEDLASESLVGA